MTFSRATGPPRREVLSKRAHDLGAIIQMYQKSLKIRRELEDSMKEKLRTAQIKVRDWTHAGTTVRLGDFKQELRESVANESCYRMVEGRQRSV